MIGRQPGRDGEIEALIVDRYLESLLARGPTDIGDVPAALRATAAGLVIGLPRFHPSFRFEEALAARLQAAGSARLGEVVDFPAGPSPAALSDRTAPTRLAPVHAAPPHPAFVGGVLTSAAVSLAGAAYVAWRRHRSRPGSRMTRAVRAVARARTV